jgi:hypothetical protein
MRERDDAQTRTVDSIYEPERKASKRKSPIALIERFANVW